VSAAIARRLEWLVAALLLAGLVGMHVEYSRHAGGLWRDEAHTARMAKETSLAEFRFAHERDSFPVLSTLVLRAWTRSEWGASDAGLRTFGALVGLGIVAAFAFAARQLGGHTPLISWVLVGLSPLLIRAGDSIRAYGLGMLLMLLALPALWRVVRSPGVPTRGAVALAAVLSILSVQCLYQNAPLLLGIGLGAAAACLANAQPRRAALVLGIGALAALSMLPYLEIIRVASEWGVLVQTSTGAAEIRATLFRALRSPSAFAFGAWIAAGLAAAAIAGFARRRVALAADQALFCVVTIVVGSLAYGLLLMTASAHMQPWYFLPPLVIVAVCLNGVLGAGRGGLAAWVRIAFALGVAAAVAPDTWRALEERQTNVDLIAAELEASAAPGDLIVVTPWYLGIGFDYYYDGTAPWTPLPPLADRRLHRYDLLKAELAKPDPIQPVFAQMEQALAEGHAVWVVGKLPPTAGPAPEPLGVAPHRQHGWTIGAWEANWARRTAHFLASQGAHGTPQPVAPHERVQPLERARLTRFARP
jgi:hypothetical protein